MNELTLEQLNYGKYALTPMATLPATFNLDAFKFIYNGDYEELNGRVLENPEGVLKALVDSKIVEELGNARYGISQEVQEQLVQELRESGFIVD